MILSDLNYLTKHNKNVISGYNIPVIKL